MPGLLPSKFEEVAPYPDLQRLLEEHIDMQFEDLRAVLRLPLKALGSSSGGNFLAASALLAAVSGCSVLFYRPGPEAFEYPYESQERFREVLNYMPWDANAAGMQKGMGIKRLYGYARNPLAHAFGVSYHPREGHGPGPQPTAVDSGDRQGAPLDESHSHTRGVGRPTQLRRPAPQPYSSKDGSATGTAGA